MERRIIERIFIAVIILSGTLLPACYYDVEEILYPGECNPGEVSYSGTIIPILERECYTCHDALTQNGGINLEGYNLVLTQVQNGQFLGSIRHEVGFSAMPDGRPKLDNCTISKIEKWIDEGAPNN